MMNIWQKQERSLFRDKSSQWEEISVYTIECTKETATQTIAAIVDTRMLGLPPTLTNKSYYSKANTIIAEETFKLRSE